ncbi:MAG: hypothetical protein ABIW85_10750 [Variovorax sp.]
MTPPFRTIVRAALLCLATTVTAPMAFSQTMSASDCHGRLQDKAACMKEAGAAKQAMRRGNLTDESPGALQANALARCNRQPTQDQAECEARVRGTGNTKVEGSVMGGGLIRSTTTRVPAKR